jgi:hypothetical protein
VQAHLIRGARGLSGANLDYLVNTVRHLIGEGIREPDLERLVALATRQRVRSIGPARTEREDNPGTGRAEAIRRTVMRQPAKFKRIRPEERRRFRYRMRIGQGPG